MSDFVLPVVLYWLAEYYNGGSAFLWWLFTLGSISSLIYTLTTYDFDYWKRRGIVSPPFVPLIGHILPAVLFKEQIGVRFKTIYDAYPTERFVGTHQFFQRTLVIRDPELIKTICVNDFSHFVDRGFFFNREVDPLAESVLFMRGNEWRRLRSKITPIFSPNKLRNMLPTLKETADEFVKRLQILVDNVKTENIKNTRDCKISSHSEIEDVQEENNNEKDYDALLRNESCNSYQSKSSFKAGLPNKDARDLSYKEEAEVDYIVAEVEKLLGGFTADAIVPCAFGLKSNVMDNPKDPFAVALHSFYEMSIYNLIEKTMRSFWPAFVLFFRMRIIPKKAHDFFTSAVNDVLKARKSGIQAKRGDFIDHMMALQDQESNSDEKSDPDDIELTDMRISANAFVIFLGGYETTSSSLSFLLLELASHPRVQEKLRSEILEVLKKHNNNISYEMMNDLHYTEMVIKETLRLYPPFPTIQRICTKEYCIPNTNKIIEKGTLIMIPTLGIQRDAKYFQSPEEFIPERFAPGAPSPPQGVYMPFGDGPRYCIGKRFAWLQMKTCLVVLMSSCKVSSAPVFKERNGPYEADPRSAITLHPLKSTLRLHCI